MRLGSSDKTAKTIDASYVLYFQVWVGEALGNWIVSTGSSKWVLTDILAKTGSILLRRNFVDRLKAQAVIRQLDFSILSPNGINKIPVYYVVVRVENLEASGIVQGLMEYAYGALRLVAVDDDELAERDGATIVAFFEGLLSREKLVSRIEVIEPVPVK